MLPFTLNKKEIIMFTILLADLSIGIDNKYDFVRNQCRLYMTGRPADFVVSLSDEEITEEQKNGTFSIGYAESLCIYRKICSIMPEYDAFVFHSSVILYEGNTYAFAGKSGIGKTTHTNLWHEVFGDKVITINGDKPIFRFRDNVLYAYGTPWCGKENINDNISAKLSAICFIERGIYNEIHKCTAGETVKKLFHQILLPSDEIMIKKLTYLLDQTVRIIPFYSLQCDISNEAVMTAYNGMKAGNDYEN